VIAAIVLLVVGWFQDGLSLIYLSIGACLLAMLLLGASVMLRRRSAPPPASRPTAPASAMPPAGETATSPSRRTAVVRRSALDDAGTDADAGDSGESVAVADPVDDEADEAKGGATTVAEPAEPEDVEDPVDPLADIRGLGPNRREALLDRFGSVEAIRDAEVSELTAVPGVSPGLARAIKDHLA